MFIVSLIIWSSHECFFIDGLKALAFNQRNVEIAKRWQEIEKSEKDRFNRRAREDVSIVDEKTKTK